MSESAPSSVTRLVRSVRFRITLAATIAFGLAFVLVAFGLVRSVKSTVEDRIRSDGNHAVRDVAARLEAGESPEALRLPARPPVALVVMGPDGEVVFTSPGYYGGDLPAGDLPERATVVRQTTSYGERLIFYRHVAAPGGRYTVAVASPLDSVRRSVDALSSVLWVGTPMLVALVGMLAWVLVGRALRPVEAIRAEVDEITHTTMHRRVPVPGSGDEVARLASTMNDMLDRLERASDRQRQFVSDASHELRSPVTTIRTDVEVALTHPEGTDWSQVAERVLGEAGRLGHLVDDLLELARIDEGRARRVVEVDLDEVVLSETSRLNAGVTVVTEGVSAGRVLGDVQQLTHAVRNILDNAARHAASAVTVTLGRFEDSVVLTIDDDGPGVPHEDRERVFERFTRLDEARDRRRGGAGLGLALVRRAVISHGGTVEISDSPSGGARVVIRLPAV
ncbi:MAG: ATP-binding protein [Acidimicrobiia bacterium]|nr:ATP-binding protein [Acidimicrobiia bacterium]